MPKTEILNSIAWAIEDDSTLPLQRVSRDKINVLPKN
jgi:hypothetical protein